MTRPKCMPTGSWTRYRWNFGARLAWRARSGVAESGQIVRVKDIDRMQWDDEDEDLNGVYHLDLRLYAR
jgi:hypothetical protein